MAEENRGVEFNAEKDSSGIRTDPVASSRTHIQNLLTCHPKTCPKYQRR